MFGDLSVSGFLKSVIVDEGIERFDGTLVDNILSIFNSHGESRVDLFFAKVKWVKGRWNRSSWGDNVSEVGVFVSEFSSEETIHGVVERGDFEVSEKHTDRFIVFSFNLFKVSRGSHDNININFGLSESKRFTLVNSRENIDIPNG